MDVTDWNCTSDSLKNHMACLDDKTEVFEDTMNQTTASVRELMNQKDETMEPFDLQMHNSFSSTKTDFSELEIKSSSNKIKSKEESIVEKEIEEEIKEIENQEEVNEKEADLTITDSILNETDNELYSTAQTSQSILFPCTIDPEETKDLDSSLTLTDCQILFITSSQDFYIQLADFDDKLAQIQPIIDDCLDPFDLSISNLCVAQFDEDELYYRCRVRKWNEAENTADVRFVDFGNDETVSIDYVTAMDESLQEVKPLVVRCRFNTEFSTKSRAFKNLEKLVGAETKFSVRVDRAELNMYYNSIRSEFEPLVARLFLEDGERDLEVNGVTLDEERLWSGEEKAAEVKTVDTGEMEKLLSNSEIKQEPIEISASTLLSCSTGNPQDTCQGESTLVDVDESISGLNESAYLKVTEKGSDISVEGSFQGHGSKWFVNETETEINTTDTSNDGVTEIELRIDEEGSVAENNDKSKVNIL